jgi:hypothetical protein
MEPAVQRTLHRVRHENFHLAFAEILDVMIRRPVLELFALGRAHSLPKPLKPQEVIPPKLLRPLLNRKLRRRWVETFWSRLIRARAVATCSSSTPNNRVRNLVDLVLLARSNLDTDLVGTAIRATFERRGTHPQPGEPAPPADDWMAPFNGLAHQCNLAVDIERAFTEISQLFVDIGRDR